SPRVWLYDALVRGLRDDVLPGQADPMQAYRVGALAQLAEHLRLAERRGALADQAKLDDAAALLGTRPATPLEADAAVQQLALSAGPERDADLIRYFWRDYARTEALLRPLLGELAETATLSPVR